jgi:hypothetical protein
MLTKIQAEMRAEVDAGTRQMGEESRTIDDHLETAAKLRLAAALLCWAPETRPDDRAALLSRSVRLAHLAALELRTIREVWTTHHYQQQEGN